MKITNLKKTYTLSFLFALHVALAAYINSTFLSGVVSEKYVGLIFTSSAIITLLFLLNSTNALRKLGNRKFAIYIVSLNILGLIGLITSSSSILTIASFMVFNITNVLFFFSADIFVEHFSGTSQIGKTRGVYLTMYNIGWMVSPFITGTLASGDGGYRNVYIATAFIALVVLIAIIKWIKSFEDTEYKAVPFYEGYKFLREKHHLASINIIYFILQFFYVWMVVYTPIYLIEHIGFTWKELSIMFTIMLTPFVFMPITLGHLIEKYQLHKTKLIKLGVTIMSISTASIFFLDTSNIFVWAFILLLTRIGASMVEAVSEIYFFTHVKEENANILSIFRNMAPLSYIVAPLLGTAILAFLPFKFLFIILGIFVITITYYIPKLRHSQNELHLSN
jgi:MFS family permease